VKYTIALLPGDGIGPEVTAEAVKVLNAAAKLAGGLELSYETFSVGAGEYLKSGDPLPPATLEEVKQFDAILLGAMGLPHVRWADGTEMTPQIDLRELLDLYLGLRPIRLYAAQDSPLKGYQSGEIDFLLIRENTEGLFFGRKQSVDPTAAEVRDVMRISRQSSERLFQAAFRYAKERRGKVTLVDKANVLPSMAFFRRVFQEVAAEFPDVESEAVYVDAMSLYLVQDPRRYDVVVTENMYGDILSDLAAGLIGGMGMAPSGDVGDRWAVFQPSHGTAPTIAGRNIANPIATILSGAMMLEWFGSAPARTAAAMIHSAVKRLMGASSERTCDMGGSLKTSECGDRIVALLGSKS
jgi:3-isopropylmalate dehydrogenase